MNASVHTTLRSAPSASSSAASRRVGRCAALFVWLWAVIICGAHAAQPPVTALAVVPGSTDIVVGSQAGLEVRSWPYCDAARRLEVDATTIHDVCFAADARRLIAVGGSPSESGEVIEYEWPSGRLIARRKVADDVLYAVAVNHAGTELIVAGADQFVRWGQLGSQDGFEAVAGHSRPVVSAIYLPGDDRALTAAADQSLRLWDRPNGRQLRVLDQHTAAIHAVALRPSASAGPPWIATASADTTVRFWQPTIGRLVRFVRMPSEPVSVAWLPDGSRLAVGSIDGQVRMVDPETLDVVLCQRKYLGCDDPNDAEGDALDWIRALVVLPAEDGRRPLLLGSGARGRVYCWEIP